LLQNFISRTWRYESEPSLKPQQLTCYKRFVTNSSIVLMFVEHNHQQPKGASWELRSDLQRTLDESVRTDYVCCIAHKSECGYWSWCEKRQKDTYTLLCILQLTIGLFFFSIYFLHSYSNARDETSLGGIWIIMLLWWGHHRLTEGWIVVYIKLMIYKWVFLTTTMSWVPQAWSL